ncbi:MAG TPA: hypothetical protein VEN81_03520, partial [Planctomycetota bacterium]|nr:hypothetical protein [Planctomycetota bacterium]
WIALSVALGPACGGGGGGGGGNAAPPPSFTGVGVPASPSVGNSKVPAGLSSHFELGIANFDLTWNNGAGGANIPFGYRSQYLSGGVNTGAGWSTWNNPPGDFAALYMTASDASASGAIISVFDYYQIVGSSPNAGSQNPDPKLQNPATMASYYGDFKLLMTTCKTFGKTVIVHVEPDFWGFCQSAHGNKPETIPVCVSNTGLADAAGLNDNLCGFAQLLVKLRDLYAPNVLIAFHASAWGTGSDLIKNKVDPVAQANAIGGFFTSLGANFDLVFHDPADRDAGYYQYVVGDGGASWWAAPADFNRYQSYLAQMATVTGRRNILWQVPLGNTKTKTCNNSNGHYQDNRVEYWLDDAPHANIQAYANADVIGIIWGAPQNGTTHYDDSAGDGVTNPGATGTTETVSDDDGGYLRAKGAAYYLSPISNP